MAGRAFGSMLTSVGTDVGVLVYTGIIATAGVLVGMFQQEQYKMSKESAQGKINLFYSSIPLFSV